MIMVMLLVANVSCGSDPAGIEMEVGEDRLYANGEDMAVITIRAVTEDGERKRGTDYEVTLSISGAEVEFIGNEFVGIDNIVRLIDGEAELKLISTFETGEVIIKAEAEEIGSGEGGAGEIKIELIPDLRDRDRDGFPDVVELTGATDRLNFRRWFCTIAESQLWETNRRWAEVNNDCAGFIRFAYTEALKVHDDRFFDSYTTILNPATPDVKRFNYPSVPLLGEAVFRIKDGPFTPKDITDEEIEGTFSPAASAGLLLLYNVVPLKDRTKLTPGDLLFFFNPDNPDMPYHSMVYLGEWGRISPINEETPKGDSQDWVIYHTGPRDEDDGEVRKVRLGTLKEHPDERWRPVKGNENFLGYFRFKILD